MSRIAREVKSTVKNEKYHKNTVINFNGGESFKLDPIMRLKMIAASSIFGEASYYRSNVKDGRYGVVNYSSWGNESDTLKNDRLFKEFDGKTTTEVFTEAIDEALDYDFGATLNLAIDLRKFYNMRLNPQVIMVRAAIHPKRKEWTKEHPSEFSKINQKVMSRADEPMVQLAYYLWLNDGKKNGIPSIMKRSIADRMATLKPYDINKYKSAEIGMINACRLVHANSEPLNELMKTGSIAVQEDEETWEQLRSKGESWMNIWKKCNIGHMALLRNIRNFFSDEEFGKDYLACKAYLEKLKDGVEKGKQFPYRYYTAYKMIDKIEIAHKQQILDTLEECIDISIKNLPKLPGKTVILSDNSGSAWNGFTSEYGTTEIAEIDNLSAVIAGICSEEADIVKFGTHCKWFGVSKRNGALIQADKINENRCNDVGGSTEPGVDEFFQTIINGKIHYDNIIIYSDLQVGHLRLGGNTWAYRHAIESKSLDMNVYQALDKYRNTVNKKCNFFSIQTAGYDNVIVPEMAYRTALLTGWTGKETLFMKNYIDLWNEIETQNK
jgi:hypothetical protein